MTDEIGRTAKGEPVRAVTLENPHHRLTVWSLGARIAAWQTADGRPVLDAVRDVSHAEGKGRHHASIIAPVANRISGATAELDGQTHRFEANEGRNTLHSGSAGSQLANWDVRETGATHAVLSFRHDRGAGGFPGPVLFAVTYSLDDATLTLEIAAEAEAPAFVNPAFHPYFLAPQGSALCVKSDHYLPVDDKKIPTGEVADVVGTKFDLRRALTPDTNIDHAFLLHGDLSLPAAVLQTPDHRVEIATDAPALQVFTGKPGLVAIEPEIHPDAPNRAGFPDIVLRPGATFRQSSRWRVTPR